VVLSMARLSAGAGYQYLLRDTCCADGHRDAGTSLTSYYTASGYPPGCWHGTGLTGLGADAGSLPSAGAGIVCGSVVTEEQMRALYGSGRDPVTNAMLGTAYRTFKSLADRITDATGRLPADMSGEQRAVAVAGIKTREANRRMPVAVAGFDLTFTLPKSASVLWALADPRTQEAIVGAHQSAVTDAIAFIEQHALFTRMGANGCAQVPTQGMVAAGFEHWDTRTADPNLHTHLVVANKVQGADGTWRSVDSRALHHAVVAVSELYDNLVADNIATTLSVSWEWRDRGPRRTPAYEIAGVSDDLLTEFSTRSRLMDTHVRAGITEFTERRGRQPSRAEVSRIRQKVTRATRPAKTVHPLLVLMREWRDRALRRTGRTPEELTALALGDRARASASGARASGARIMRPLRNTQIPGTTVDQLAAEVITRTMERRATWTRWNLLAETARATRGLRMATATDRLQLHDRITDAALSRCVRLNAPQLFTVPAEYVRPDGTSVFTRAGETAYTDVRVLDAEQRLLVATADQNAPRVSPDTATRALTNRRTPRMATRAGLQQDQLHAVVSIAASRRRVEVLVGPAGTGKTTTLHALRTVWETAYGPGSVIGLAPSATAAAQLGAALGTGCENTAKWVHESTGPGADHRHAAYLTLLERERTTDSRNVHGAQRTRAAAERVALEQDQWTLRQGQLLIVDEASLAGTFTLDTLVTQATQAGAKVVLVGDHHQLTAVDAGGAFGLLAGTPGVQELKSLWRFRNRWEANASRQLRKGNPDCLAAYEAHDRITAGASEVMIDAAYTAWRDADHAGTSTILVAVDGHTVAALNARARQDRVSTGRVAANGVCAADGVTVGVGDRVVTRSNDRWLRLPGGHVRNGDLWTITATHSDGSLTLTPAHHHDRSPIAENPSLPAPTVHVPAAYVREHVELGYATTVHRAQGITVDDAHLVVSAGATRQSLYVAMTRGRTANHVYVATDDIDASCDGIPDPHTNPTARDILQRVLATDGADKSATQTLRDALDTAESLRALAPVRATLIADADLRRWERLLPVCGLTPEQTQHVLASPAAGALFAALRRGEVDGHPMPQVLHHLITDRPLSPGTNPGVTTEPGTPDTASGDVALDVAAVLHSRVIQWQEHEPPRPRPPVSGRGDVANRALDRLGVTESILNPGDTCAPAIEEIDALLHARLRFLNLEAITTRPTWMQPLGHLPTSIESDAADWTDALATIAAHRDLLRSYGPHPVATDPTADCTDRQRQVTAAHAVRVATRLGATTGSPAPTHEPGLTR
jgi:conjugative relaxase-like TrwC/TraI family protein